MEVIRGKNSINSSGELLSSQGCEKVFLITGFHLRQQEFIKENIAYHFIKQGANVDETEVQRAFELFKEKKATCLFAIGGGSVIDLAKAIIYKCIESSLSVPYFAVAPTTLGAGSEATHFAVVYYKGKKYSWVHPSLQPVLVFLDPGLSEDLPAYHVAVTGMDALSQAIESYWSRSATEESKEYAEEAIILWRENYLDAVEGSKAARVNMLEAAHKAGKAINITRTTGPHALSYFLTIHHDIPHGQAVGLFLPVFFIYNKASKELCNLLGAENMMDAVELIRERMINAGLAVMLEELGIDKSVVITSLLEEVNEERFENNPEPFDEQHLTDLINEYL